MGLKSRLRACILFLQASLPILQSPASMSGLLTGALRRVATQAARAPGKGPQAAAPVRNFATYKSASPETPLCHYKATQQATSSINHRLFYVNVVAMYFIYDAGSGMLGL